MVSGLEGGVEADDNAANAASARRREPRVSYGSAIVFFFFVLCRKARVFALLLFNPR